MSSLPKNKSYILFFKFLENLTFSELVVDIKLNFSDKQSYLSMQIFKNQIFIEL